MKELDSTEISTKAIAAKTSFTIWPRQPQEGGRIDSLKVIAKSGSGEVLIKSVTDCYTMANVCMYVCMSVDLNVIHISTNQL